MRCFVNSARRAELHTLRYPALLRGGVVACRAPKSLGCLAGWWWRSKCDLACAAAAGLLGCAHESYLVDPASSHTLVLRIYPCMSKCSVSRHTRLRTAHYNSYSLFDGSFYVDNRGNSRANTCQSPGLSERWEHLLDAKSISFRCF